ncbi:MAG: cytochrome d ubiquinol oxidase subunit II [Chitinophagales bacterium]|nr:cytochrome d ubiquinol oxidase subunit II [Chitinophagales bacterium]HAE14332.1 cytochrome d ubiquinol oxidase subunit II [Bacteroidota bacterium]MCB9020147.1 cytochrome d ubiquinol oxidase subunit II [Chitinophagales bacterium]HPE98408.1 cytochrome d ubiquinol oxidase subunit II [Chitinophagales bacterium]HQU39998.1 cytochrome d ubiquinol oxidase subunit II [Chitinophagales bacterium]
MATFLGIDYPTLWFLLVGALFSGYAILDGFDLGAGAWHLFFQKEESRRIALNAVGPVWDGNEVWLVIGGGALFAGFPMVYATLFSAMYIPFMLFLVFIILRAVSIEFRSKESMKWWRRMWDIAYSVSSILLAVLLGVVLGNVLQGMPLDADHEFSGHWLQFLNPYALLTGITTLALMMLHGALYLSMKTEGRLFVKIVILMRRSIIAFLVLFSLVTLYTLLYIPHLTDRFREEPALFVAPLLAVLSIANIPRLVSKRKYPMAFLFSSLVFAFMLIIVAIELYPVLVIATNDAANSLTIYNSASSEKSLGIMLTIAAIGAPLVGIYTIIVYRTFRGKVKMDDHSY